MQPPGFTAEQWKNAETACEKKSALRSGTIVPKDRPRSGKPFVKSLTIATMVVSL